MQEQKAGQYGFTNTIVAVYSLKGFIQPDQPKNFSTVTDKFWALLNPLNSLCVIVSAEFAEWFFQVDNQYFGINEKVRNWVLPPDKLAISVNRCNTTLNIIANFPPLKMLCLDAAMLASRAELLLNLTPKIKACITRTGDIAIECLSAKVSRKGDSLTQVIHRKINHHVTSKKISSDPSENANAGWFSSITNFAEEALKSELGQSLLSVGTQKVKTMLTNTANDGIKMTIASAVEKANQELANRENVYLTEVSKVVYDSTAKQVIANTFSVVAVATGAWFLPAVLTNTTKWTLGLFISEPYAEVATTIIKSVGILYTGIGFFAKANEYRARRLSTQASFSPLENIEAGVVSSISQQIEQLLPEAGDNSNFASRCASELPLAFKNGGRKP